MATAYFCDCDEFPQIPSEHRDDCPARPHPMPPNNCNCASFFTVRGVHKKDCPAYVPPAPNRDQDMTSFRKSLQVVLQKFLIANKNHQVNIEDWGDAIIVHFIDNGWSSKI